MKEWMMDGWTYVWVGGWIDRWIEGRMGKV